MQGISVSYNDPENIRDDEEEAVPYKGLVKDGVIVLDDAIVLPEDPILRVAALRKHCYKAKHCPGTLAKHLVPFIGKAVGLLVDTAKTHDP